MNRKLQLGTILLITLTLVFSVVGRTSADTFNQNKIIDDGVFDNANSMTMIQINNFLNQFPASCISTSHGFSAPDPTGYNPTNGYIYGPNVSGGKVIYDAAQAYGINPQVLLTTLQKEQSIVTGAGGCSTLAYAAATGYGCPDSGTTHSYTGVNLYSTGATFDSNFNVINPGTAVTAVNGTCVNTSIKAGFSQQVIRGAWLLKFGEQRSEGNINWAVIKGSWDNSDDPQSCYGGPMTQGTWQRCPSGTTTFYDGYTTIDATSVHMDDGATAALYWYTPHFSGNQHFFTIFTGWFGSTMFPQPLGGALYYQQSTGKVFLVTDSTRYYVPSWGMMTNYGLDAYPEITADDTTIQQFTDGGTLSSLVADSGGGVYLVNNKSLYHLSPTMCTAWGLSCFDSNIVKALGTTFETEYLQTGFELTPLAASNGAIYKLSAGQKSPIANPKTLSDLGFSSTAVLVTSAVNSTQPLGPLLMTTPGIIRFSTNPTIYYYDGSAYYSVPGMTSYNDWSLGSQPQLGGAISSYDTTPPASQVLTAWYQDSGGNRYIIDQARRVQIPASLQSLWGSVTFSTQPQALANSLPAVTLQPNIYANPAIYTLGNAKKHYVPSWLDYLALGITNGATTALQPDKLTPVPQGNDALGDGVIIAVQGNPQSLYVINNGKTTHIPDPNTYNDYGFSWANILSYPSSILTDYPLASSDLSSGVLNGTYYVVGTGSMYQLSASLAGDFGVIGSQFQSISAQTAKNIRASSLSRFLYNTSNGQIYYASGGAIHYVATYSAFVAYGGTHNPMSAVNSSTLSLFNIAQSLY